MYHLFIGVERIYIMDNSDTPTYQRMFRGNAQVEVVPWWPSVVAAQQRDPGDSSQSTATRYFMENLKSRHRWAMHIDIDEFVALKRHCSVRDLASDGGFGGLGLPWLIFGCNGNVEQEDKPVLVRFTQRAPLLDSEHHIKTLFVCAKTAHMTGPRVLYHSPNDTTVTSTGVPIFGPFAPQNHTWDDTVALYHYASKSWEEYVARRFGRPRATVERPRKPQTSTFEWPLPHVRW